jgi:hypothetical protein
MTRLDWNIDFRSHTQRDKNDSDRSIDFVGLQTESSLPFPSRRGPGP